MCRVQPDTPHPHIPTGLPHSHLRLRPCLTDLGAFSLGMACVSVDLPYLSCRGQPDTCPSAAPAWHPHIPIDLLHSNCHVSLTLVLLLALSCLQGAARHMPACCTPQAPPSPLLRGLRTAAPFSAPLVPRPQRCPSHTHRPPPRASPARAPARPHPPAWVPHLCRQVWGQGAAPVTAPCRPQLQPATPRREVAPDRPRSPPARAAPTPSASRSPVQGV